MPIGLIAIAALAVILLLIIVISNIHIVQQSRAYVIERLGAFTKVWQVGIHVKVPFIERVAKKVSLKEQVLDYPPQPVITKDNVTMQIDTVVYYQITDPKALHLRRRAAHDGHGDAHGHNAPQHHRRSRARPDPHSPATSSTPRCAPSSTRPPTPGASRSTASSSKTSCPRRTSRTPWKSR